MLRQWPRLNKSCFPLQPLAECMPVRLCVKRKESSHILPKWNGVRGNLDFDDTTRVPNRTRSTLRQASRAFACIARAVSPTLVGFRYCFHVGGIAFQPCNLSFIVASP